MDQSWFQAISYHGLNCQTWLVTKSPIHECWTVKIIYGGSIIAMFGYQRVFEATIQIDQTNRLDTKCFSWVDGTPLWRDRHWCNPENDWLVGGFNPPEKYESHLGWLFPIYGKIKHVPNHQSEKMTDVQMEPQGLCNWTSPQFSASIDALEYTVTHRHTHENPLLWKSISSDPHSHWDQDRIHWLNHLQ